MHLKPGPDFEQRILELMHTDPKNNRKACLLTLAAQEIIRDRNVCCVTVGEIIQYATTHTDALNQRLDKLLRVN